jgi:NLI interacting factor-like phosphatase
MKQRIAIDLDLTLGEAIIHPLSNSVLGFRKRPGCIEFLEQLRQRYTLCLWSIGSRWYVDTVLAFDLGRYFDETYSWDEMSGEWKDIRRINAEYLIDDNPAYREKARDAGIEADRYVLVPAYGSPEDTADPLLWIRQIDSFVQ